MTIWQRSDRVQLCGRCLALIEEGEPVFVIEIATMTRPLIRCVGCVGPAPEELVAAGARRDAPA